MNHLDMESMLHQANCANARRSHLWCALLLVCVAPAAAQDDVDPAHIAGTWIGQVFNGGDLDPVRTTFTFAGGRLGGSYSVDDESGDLQGTLSSFVFEDSHTLALEWTDMYGEGYVRLVFSPDYRRFDGHWGSYDSDSVNPWYGEKK